MNSTLERLEALGKSIPHLPDFGKITIDSEGQMVGMDCASGISEKQKSDLLRSAEIILSEVID